VVGIPGITHTAKTERNQTEDPISVHTLMTTHPYDWQYAHMTTQQQAPAGWYLDPEHTGLMRWWDGYQWYPSQQAQKNTPAVLSIIFGAVAIPFAFTPFTVIIAWALALTAMTLATIGNYKWRTIRVGRAQAFTGLTLATVAVAASLIMLAL